MEKERRCFYSRNFLNTVKNTTGMDTRHKSELEIMITSKLLSSTYEKVLNQIGIRSNNVTSGIILIPKMIYSSFASFVIRI